MEITQNAVFYLIIMVVVIFLGLAIVAKGNPLALFKQAQIAGVFEPGKLTPKSEINDFVSLVCSNPSKVVLEKAEFMYKGRPSDKQGSIDFAVILDYNNLLFLGTDENGQAKRISCSAAGSEDISDCPPVTMQFELRGAGPFDHSANQTFHFTVWKASQVLTDAAQENGMTLDKILDTYSNYYVSSFSANKQVAPACQQSTCVAFDTEEACAEGNGCYWTNNWFESNSCQACPTFTECRDYSVTQCTRCPIPKANCEVGLSLNLGSGFQECQVIE